MSSVERIQVTVWAKISAAVAAVCQRLHTLDICAVWVCACHTSNNSCLESFHQVMSLLRHHRPDSVINLEPCNHGRFHSGSRLNDSRRTTRQSLCVFMHFHTSVETNTTNLTGKISLSFNTTVITLIAHHFSPTLTALCSLDWTVNKALRRETGSTANICRRGNELRCQLSCVSCGGYSVVANSVLKTFSAKPQPLTGK